MDRIEAAWATRDCPECCNWPTEIGLKIVTEIIEPGQPISPPDEHDPTQFGPCACCGCRHKAKVVEIVS
jgi:hypothetical protein